MLPNDSCEIRALIYNDARIGRFLVDEFSVKWEANGTKE